MSDRRRRRGGLAPVALLLGAHVALLLHFVPRGFLSMPAPFLTSAFALDAYRADRALRALSAGGHFSTYDPQVLAGQVAGVWEPFGARGLALLAVAGARAHLGFLPAFGLAQILLHALVPAVGYVAARAFGSTRTSAAVVLAIWSLLTFFDSLTHYAWFSGRIQWVMASALAVAQAVFADRAIAEGRPRWGAAAFAAGAAATTMHPVAALLAATITVVTALRARVAPASVRAVLVLCALPSAAVVVAAALHGAVTSEPLASVFRTGPSSALWDLVEIPGPGYRAAGASRTLLRVLCIAIGAFGWRRARRPFGALATLAAAALAVAYVGPVLPVAWPTEPYFFAILVAFAASLPAAELAVSVSWPALFVRGAPDARAALLVAAAIAVPRVARTALTYAPELLPARRVRGPSDLAVSALGGINEPFPDPLGYDPAPPGLPSLATFLLHENRSDGRVLTDDPVVAGYLALYTPLAVLGPLGERGAPSSAADPTPLLEGRAGARGVADFIDGYGVGFVVLGGRRGPFDAASPLLGDSVDVGGYRVRRVLREPSLVARGTAHVTVAASGSLRVDGAAGARVTLRYHYVPGLACRPGCVVERDPSLAFEPGFVSVPNPPVAFEIFAP